MNPDIRKRIGQGLDVDFSVELSALDKNISAGEVFFFLTALKSNLEESEEKDKIKFKNLIGEGKAEGDELEQSHEIYRAILVEYFTHEPNVGLQINQRIEVNQATLLNPRQYFDNYVFDANRIIELGTQKALYGKDEAIQEQPNQRYVDVGLQIWILDKEGYLSDLRTQIQEQIDRTGFLKEENFKFKVRDLLAEQTEEEKEARIAKRIELLTGDLWKSERPQLLIEELLQNSQYRDSRVRALNGRGQDELKSIIKEEAEAQEEKERRAEDETRNLVKDLVQKKIKAADEKISEEALDAQVSETLFQRTKGLMLRGVLERMMEERAKGSYNDDFDPIAVGDEEDLKISLLRKDIRKTIVEVARDSNIVSALPFIGSDIERENAPELGAEEQYTLAQDAAARLIGTKFRQNKVEKAITAAVNIQKVFHGFVDRRNTSAFRGTENVDAEEAIGKAGIVVAALRQLDGYTDHKGKWVDLGEKTLQVRLKDPHSLEHVYLIRELAKNTGRISESFADFYRIYRMLNLIKNRQTETQEEDSKIEDRGDEIKKPELLGYEERIYNKLSKQMPGLEFVFSQIEKYNGNAIDEKSPNLKSLYQSKGFIANPTKKKKWEMRISEEDLQRVKLLKSANQIRKWAGLGSIERYVEDLQVDILEIQGQLRELQEQIVDRNTGDEQQPNRFATVEHLDALRQLAENLQQIAEYASRHDEWDQLQHDGISQNILDLGLKFEGGLVALDTRVQNLGALVGSLQEDFNRTNQRLDLLNNTSQVNQRSIQDLERRFQELRNQLDTLPTNEAIQALNQRTIEQLIQRIEEEREQATIKIRQLKLFRQIEESYIRERIDALEEGLAGRIKDAVRDALQDNIQQQPAGFNVVGGGVNAGVIPIGLGVPSNINVNINNRETDRRFGEIDRRLDQLNQSTEQQTQLLAQRLDASDEATTALTNSLVELTDLVRLNATTQQLDAAVDRINLSITEVQTTLLARINAINDAQIQANLAQTEALEQAKKDLQDRIAQLRTQLTDATAGQALQLREVREALELELEGVKRALEKSEAQREIDARRHEDNLRDTGSRLKTGLDSMFASLTSDNEALREQIEKQREESKKKERESLDPEGLRKRIAEGVLRDNLMPTIMGGAAVATSTEYGEPIFSYSGIETGNLFMSHANAAFDNWDTSARDENSTYTSLTGKQRNPLISIAKLEDRPVPGGDVPVYCVLKVDHEGVGQTFISEATFLKEIDQPLAEMHTKKTKSVKEAFARGEIPSLEDSLMDGVAEGSPEERLMKKIYDKVSKENALAAEVKADKALKAKYQEIIEGIAAPGFDVEREFRLDLLNKGKFKELRNSLVYGNGDFREDLFLGHEDKFAKAWDNLNIRRGLNDREITAHYKGIIDLVVDDDARYDLQEFLANRNFGDLRDQLLDAHGNIQEDLFNTRAGHPDPLAIANAQRLLTKINIGEDGLIKSMQEYSEQNYPIILKTLEEEHQRLDTVIKDKEQNLLTQGETDFVKDKYKKIIDMMADRPLKEEMELLLQGPGGVDLVFDKLFKLNQNTHEPAHGCIFSDPKIIIRFNALDIFAADYAADKERLCRDAIAAIDTNRPTKLQMLERLNRDKNIADLLFDSTRDARGTVTYTKPKYEGLFDQVVLDIPRPRITGIVDNSDTARDGLAVAPSVLGVPDDITKFQNIINLMSDRPSRADFGSILLNKGADELLQQLFEKDNLDNYANRCVFNARAVGGIIADYEALVNPLRHAAATPAEKQAFCQRAIAEVDIYRPTKRQMQNLLDRGNFADIRNALFNGASNPIYLNLFETIDRDNPIPTITNVVNRDVNVGDLARSSVNPVEKAAHVANFMGSRGAQVEGAKQAELQTAIDRIKGYPARVVAGDMRVINHDGLVTKVLKDNKLVDKVAQESANKVSAVYNEGFFANRAEIAKIRTQEGAALNPEEKRRMLEKSSALGSVLDLKFESSTFQGTSFLRPSRNQFSVMFNGDFGVAGSVNKCGFTQDIAYVPVPGGHKAFMRARVCTSDNLEARRNGTETYYVLSVYKKGVLSEEEHRVGDVVMDYDTVFHLTKRKDGTPKYEPVSLGSVKESVFQGAAKTFNLVKGAATLLVPSILKPENVDSSIKGEQEFGKREFAEIRQTVKNMQVLIGSTGNEGERAFSTMAQGEVINHTHGRRTYVKTFLRPGYDNSVRVHDRTAFAKDGDRLEFKFDKDGNLSGGVTDDTIRITENGATHDYRGSSRFVDSKYLKMLGVNADIELLGKVSVVSHAVGGNGTDKAGDVVFSHEIFYKTLEAGREVILPVFERGTTTPTEVFKIHLREQMLAKDPTAVPPPTISDEDIRQKLEEMQNKFLGSASVSVSIKPWTAALDHTAAIEGGEWKLHAIKYDSKARDSVVEVEAGRNGIASSALKMDLLQALASKQAQAVAEALADLSHDATDAQKEAAKNIPDQDVKNGLDALRTGIGAASKKEIANLNKGILKTPPLECVLRGKAKPLPEIVTTKKHGVLRHAGRAMNRSKNNIRLGLADDSRSR